MPNSYGTGKLRLYGEQWRRYVARIVGTRWCLKILSSAIRLAFRSPEQTSCREDGRGKEEGCYRSGNGGGSGPLKDPIFFQGEHDCSMYNQCEEMADYLDTQ